MCKTMNELEKVVADYRSLKALKEELEEQLKDAEREIIGYLDSKMQSLRQQKRLTITLSWSVIRLNLDVFCGML